MQFRGNQFDDFRVISPFPLCCCGPGASRLLVGKSSRHNKSLVYLYLATCA
nr:MAG TPA: hypothetical protein [Caudoviricetes sp.]